MEKHNSRYAKQSLGHDRWLGWVAAASLLLGASHCMGASWFYDVSSNSFYHATASGVSNYFHPTPPTAGGTNRARIGTTGGYIAYTNTEIHPTDTTNFGVRMVAPTTASVNKYSVYGNAGGKTGYLRCNFIVSGGSQGMWFFCLGNGAIFSDNNGISTAPMFALLRLSNSASDTVVTRYLSNATYVAVSYLTEQLVTNSIEIYYNNSTAGANYSRGGAQTLGVNKWDLWVNDALVGDEQHKGALADDTAINSFMVFGQGSAGNVAVFQMDDMYYGNAVPTLVTLASFAVTVENGLVVVRWETASEERTVGFHLYRQGAEGAWLKVNADLIPAQGGLAGGAAGAAYSFVDMTAVPGTMYVYKLVEIEDTGAENTYGPFERFTGPVQLNSATATPAGMELRWASRDLEMYSVLRASDLLTGFSTIRSGIPATPPENVFVDDTAGGASAMYYRIGIEP